MHIAEGATSMEEVLAQSPRSERVIGSLCKYKCGECQKEYNSYLTIYDHARRTGHLNKAREVFFTKCTSKIVGHACLECGKLLACDLHFLRRHIRRRHGKSLHEYCQEFGCMLKGKTVGPFAQDFLKTFEPSEDCISQNLIGNLCFFSCSLCDKELGSFKAITHHMTKFHGATFSGEQVIHKLLKETVTHKCLLCSKLLICDVYFLGSHFKRKHGIAKLEDYCKMTGCTTKTQRQQRKLQRLLDSAERTREIGSLCKWRCKFCSDQFSASYLLKAHMLNRHGFSDFQQLDLNNLLSRKVVHICKFCGKEMLCEKRRVHKHYSSKHGEEGLAFYEEAVANSARNHMEEGSPVHRLETCKQTETRIGNLCKYMCKVCEKEFCSYSGMYDHASKSGHMKGVKPSLVLSSLIESIAHPCRMCGMLILCDLNYLRSHLKKAHQVTLENYCKDNHCKVIPKGISKYMEKFLKQDTIKKTHSQDVIGNLCKFSCYLCQQNFRTVRDTKDHIYRVHNLSLNGEEVTHNTLKNIVTHACLLCSKELLCETLFLSQHFVRKHNIKNVEEYCKITGCKRLLRKTKVQRKQVVLDRSQDSHEKIISKQFNIDKSASKTVRNYMGAVKRLHGITTECKVVLYNIFDSSDSE